MLDSKSRLHPFAAGEGQVSPTNHVNPCHFPKKSCRMTSSPADLPLPLLSNRSPTFKSKNDIQPSNTSSHLKMAEAQTKDDNSAQDPKANTSENTPSKESEEPKEEQGTPPFPFHPNSISNTNPNLGFGLSSYGNSAGSKIESTLSPVGNPVGKGLATAVAPVGNIIGAVVDNGLMQAGRTAGGMTGKGAGGLDTEGTRKGWEEVKEEKRLEEEIGGREQTGENPLGL